MSLGTAESTGSELTLDEAIELKQLESEIQLGQRNFVAVGNALAAIRDRRLYRPAYATFEDYCDRRWQISVRRAYQFVDGAAVFNNLHNCAEILPANEAQARPLSELDDPYQQCEAWLRAVGTARDGRVTSQHVKEVVRQFRGEPETSSEPAAMTLHEAIGLLRPCVFKVFQSWPAGQFSVLVEQLRDLASELEANGELCP